MRKVNHLMYGRNAPYNDAVGQYVEEMLQTEKREPVDYIAPLRYRPRLAKHTMPKKDPRIEIITHQPASDPTGVARYDIGDLGRYEHLLFASLAWHTSSTYVLAGEMGSGKSATMTFLRDVLQRERKGRCAAQCHDCHPIVVFLSLDAGTRYTAPNTDIVARVRDDLNDSLHAELRRLLPTADIINKFDLFTETASDQKFHRFSVFKTERTVTLMQHGVAWSSLDPLQKTDFLLNWVKQQNTPEVRLDALMAIASFIRETVRMDQSCFVILIDNIDRHFDPTKQLGILQMVFGLQTTGVKVLLAMRHTTFAGLESNAAFSFSYILHAGPDPLEVGLERMRHYSARWDSWLEKSKLTELERACLQGRLNAVMTLLQDRRSHYRQHLAALAGGSIRAGLTLLVKLFINFTIPFEHDEPVYKQDWLRAALLGDTDDQHLPADDRYIANVFANPKDANFSWAPLRLLQLVNGFYVTRAARNAKTIWTLAKEILGGPDDDELLAAMNHLLQDTRPLLWVDGAYSFASSGDLLARNNVCHVTRAGRGYMRRLLRDSVYLQETLFSVSWPERSVPREVDSGSAVGRSRGARAIADVLITEDFQQYERLMSIASRKTHLPALRIDPIGVVIAATLAESQVESMKNSVKDALSAADTLSECNSWLEIFRRAKERLLHFKIPPQPEMQSALGRIDVVRAFAQTVLVTKTGVHS
jgi:hypothetical protein